jgi:hypothetical protein
MQLGEKANFSSSIVRSTATILTRSELLTKVKELGDVSRSDLVHSAGYVSTKKDGTEHLNSWPSTRPCWKPRASALVTAEAVAAGRAGVASGTAGGRGPHECETHSRKTIFTVLGRVSIASLKRAASRADRTPGNSLRWGVQSRRSNPPGEPGPGQRCSGRCGSRRRQGLR